MELIRVYLLSACIFIQTSCFPHPGYTHHHVHHRIHVPHRIKTIYHTKIIKVPEHHHHFHEKEKIVHVVAPKHTEEHVVYPPLKEDVEDLSNFDHHDYYGESSHNILKKHAPAPTSTEKLKKRNLRRGKL